MSVEDRYCVERVKDRLWVVVDRAREGRRVGQATDETGAHKILSFLQRIRSVSARVQEALSPPAFEAA